MNIKTVNRSSANIKHLCGSVWVVVERPNEPPVYRVQNGHGQAIVPTVDMLSAQELMAIAKHKSQLGASGTVEEILISTTEESLFWTTEEILEREG